MKLLNRLFLLKNMKDHTFLFKSISLFSPCVGYYCMYSITNCFLLLLRLELNMSLYPRQSDKKKMMRCGCRQKKADRVRIRRVWRRQQAGGAWRARFNDRGTYQLDQFDSEPKRLGGRDSSTSRTGFYTKFAVCSIDDPWHASWQRFSK